MDLFKGANALCCQTLEKGVSFCRLCLATKDGLALEVPDADYLSVAVMDIGEEAGGRRGNGFFGRDLRGEEVELSEKEVTEAYCSDCGRHCDGVVETFVEEVEEPSEANRVTTELADKSRPRAT